MVSIVQGLQFTITEQLQGVGATFMVVSAKTDRATSRAWWPGRSSSPTRTARRSSEQVPGIEMITPIIFGRATLKYRDRKHTPVAVIGVNEH